MTTSGQTYQCDDLVKVAKRLNNTKRAYLYVNPLQGKHLPVSPGHALDLFSALAKKVEMRYAGERVLIVAFAETATAIGIAISQEASNVTHIMQTTREKIPGLPLSFSETHSHAPEQVLMLNGLEGVLDQVDRLVFAEDEITTGNTIVNLITALAGAYPNKNLAYGIVAIVNSMSDSRIEELQSQGIPCDYIQRIPGSYLMDTLENFDYVEACDFAHMQQTNSAAPLILSDLCDVRTVKTVLDYNKACSQMVQAALEKVIVPPGAKRVLVLGTEEFMYPPLRVANEISQRQPHLEVLCHATSRSPIAVSSAPGYPLFARYALNSVYEAGRNTFVYNLQDYDLAICITDAQTVQQAGIDDITQALTSSGCQKIQFITWGNGNDEKQL